MLFVRSAKYRQRDLANQGHGGLLSLRARQTFLLDGVLHLAVEFKIHDLQSEQFTAGEYSKR